MPLLPCLVDASVPAARRLATVHWGLLAACVLFLLVGAVVVDDYGITPDEWAQQQIGKAALDYIAGDGERALDQVHSAHDRYYGTVFEVPLVLVGRALGLDSWRDVLLSRHILTHLFFVVGGVFCYLLVLRMFGNRLLALAAMVLFLLHPRLYAHSFFNSKDIPFAAMFMVALYLTHRAFRRETLGAFLLCGVGVGLLVNLRVMGLGLFAAVLVLWALDLFLAGGAGERRRVLLAGVAFALGAVLTYYATLPGLWTDPGRFPEVIDATARHINATGNLFRGEWLYSPDGPPFEYFPVWIGITTPPVVLLFAVIGMASLFWRGARRPWAVWSKGELRFAALMLVLFATPIIAVFAIGANVYNGWRQVYFLYAPLVLLMFLGFHWIMASRGRWMKTGMYALAVTSVAVTIVSTVRIHPFQSEYFNTLVDRNDQDWLVSQYDVDYWGVTRIKLVKDILEDHEDILKSRPDQNVVFSQGELLRSIEKIDDAERALVENDIFFDGFLPEFPVSERAYVSRIYNNTIDAAVSVYGEGMENPESIIRHAMSGDPVARSTFTIYLHGRAVVFFKENCSFDHTRHPFFFDVYPVDTTVLSGVERIRGYATVDIAGGRISHDSGQCAWVVLLPAYPVDSVHTGQYNATGRLWDARFRVTLPDGELAVLAGDPVVSPAFDVARAGVARAQVD